MTIKCIGLFPGFVLCSVDLRVCFMLIPYCLVTIATEHSLKSGSGVPTAVFVFLEMT